jgi:hypothetical protein
MDVIEFEVLKNKIQSTPIKLKIASDSMQPLLRTHDVIEVHKLSKPLETFDLIVFESSGRLMCHFVWRNQIGFNEKVVTRSLKEPRADENPIHIKKVLGWVPAAKIGFGTRCWLMLTNWLLGRL